VNESKRATPPAVFSSLWSSPSRRGRRLRREEGEARFLVVVVVVFSFGPEEVMILWGKIRISSEEIKGIKA